MDNLDHAAIGQRIKMLRKKKGLSQTELAQMLGKSLRTVQKYETGEIEVSISVINQIAEILETSSTYLFGYESGTTQIKSLSDVMDFLFKLENVAGIDFHIDVKKPPRSKSGRARSPLMEKAQRNLMRICACFLSSGSRSGKMCSPSHPRLRRTRSGRIPRWRTMQPTRLRP